MSTSLCACAETLTKSFFFFFFKLLFHILWPCACTEGAYQAVLPLLSASIQVRRGLLRFFFFFTIVIVGTRTSTEAPTNMFYNYYLRYLYKFVERPTETSDNCYLRYTYKYGEAYQDSLQLLSQVPVQVRRCLSRLFTVVISNTCTSSEGLIDTFYNC